MSRKSLHPRNMVKNGFKGLKIISFIGASSLLFTQVVVAGELETVTKVPTTYNVSALSQSVNRQIPDGYAKANYQAIYSTHTDSVTPSSMDLSLQEAAEIAAQEIFKFSGEKLDNQTLEMSYSPRGSIWEASVSITPSYRFLVEIDGSTGELIHSKRVGGSDIDMNFDIDAPSTNKLSAERLDAGAKQFAEQFTLDDAYAKVQYFITKKGYIAEPIKSISYKYISTDAFAVASHTFEVTTASNKIYYVALSEDLSHLRDYIDLGKINK